MASSFAGLRANNVDADVKGLLNMLRVTDLRRPVNSIGLLWRNGCTHHVHDEDACLMQALDDMLGRDTNSADEERGLLVDDHVNELVELTWGMSDAASRGK